MTCVHAVPGAGFKRCCLHTGRYDGGNRNYFFPRVENSRFLFIEREEKEAIDFRFLFSYSPER
jgi:hypothetical protein